MSLAYLYASFRTKHSRVGRLFETITVIGAFAAVAAMLMVEEPISILISLGVSIVCVLLILLFRAADKVRRRTPL
ncbi:hypothetical protein [Vibrio variabilis]|uniref:hypothetical protein n=1 Tax=Vibrio variabilis TaxID=990271 RepID=UPI000DDA6399|nr:hypothetical protein [Vibrio variabilis]